MRLLRNLFRRVRGLVRAETIHSEIDEEARFHIEMRIDENIRRGMSPEEARRDAERRFGNLTRMKERGYEVRGGRWLETLWQDLRFGARMLLKKPGFTLIAVITLALGIGANAVIFSIVYTMLIQPLPYANAERLAAVSQVNREDVEFGVSYPDFTAWKEQNATFERMAAAASDGINVSQTTGDNVERVIGSRVSTEFFPLLGGRAQLGRVFLAEEFRPGTGRVVVLSHKLWQERFGADAGVIGRTIKLDDQNYTVVGVMPPSFLYPFSSVLWTPLESEEEPGLLQDATANRYLIIGALKPGISLEAAAKEIAALARATSKQKLAGQSELTVRSRWRWRC